MFSAACSAYGSVLISGSVLLLTISASVSSSSSGSVSNRCNGSGDSRLL
jgi:hypothetical protein